MKTVMNKKIRLAVLAALLAGFAQRAPAQGSLFNYQGRLTDNGAPANGIYDLKFTVYDAGTGGNAIATAITNSAVNVNNGLFNAALDFGPGVFTGADRWLELGARTNGAGDFATLSPRQQITPTPYAMFAGNAANAANATNAATLNGQTSASFAPATGSPAYVSKSGDTMTGKLSLPGFGLSVGGSELVVSNVSNVDGRLAVGIGTATPQSTLHLSDFLNGRSVQELIENTGPFSSASLRLKTPASGSDWTLSGLETGGGAADGFFIQNPTLGTTFAIKAGSGNVGIGTSTPSQRLEVNGGLKATSLTGDGSGLTSLNGSNLVGTIADARLSGNVALLNQNAHFSGTISASNFAGNGAGLTNVPLSSLQQGAAPDTIIIASGEHIYCNGGGFVLPDTIALGKGQTNWAARAPMPTARNNAGFCVFNNKLYVFGGEYKLYGYITNRTEIYDPVANTWTTGTPMPLGLEECGVVPAHGLIFVIGGSPQGPPQYDVPNVYAYNPATDSWTARAPMPTAISSFVSANVNGLIYVIGGYNNSTVDTTNLVQIYDPVQDHWTIGPSMPTARQTTAGVAVGGKIYVFGGFSRQVQDFTNVVEMFDPVSQTWSTRAPLPTARNGHVATVLNGLIYVTGGNCSPAVDIYNPATGSWTSGPAVPALGATSLPAIATVNLADSTPVATAGQVLAWNGTGWVPTDAPTGLTPVYSDPVSLLSRDNVFAGAFTGNGAGLTNLNASQLTGAIGLAQLPAAVVTNNSAGVNLSGTFSGDGSGLSSATTGNYVHSYSTTTQSVVTASTFQDITNQVDVQINGWSHAAGGVSFTNNQSGLYLIHYTAETTTTASSASTISLRAVVNGTEIADSQSTTVVNTANQVAPVSKSLIANLSAGDVLKFQLAGNSTTDRLVSNTGLGTARPSFSFTIVRIQ